MGEHGIYCCADSGKTIYSPTVKQLLNAGMPKEINYDAIAPFLTFQYSIGSTTLFKGITPMTPPKIQPTVEVPMDDATAAKHLSELLGRVIVNMTTGVHKVAMFLSGGLDSSTVSAITANVAKIKAKDALTATFDEHSEMSIAAEVAQHLGLRHHEVRITAAMVARDIESITLAYEEPLGDAGLINNYFLCRSATSIADLALCGDGGDEVFGGYPWHRYAKYIRLMNKIPPVVRTLVQVLVSGDPTVSDNKLERMMLFPAQPSLDDMVMYPTTAMSPQNVEWLLKSGAVKHYDFNHNDYGDLYKHMLAMDCLNMVPGKYGRKLDKFQLPIRSPLANDAVVSFAFGLPNRLCKNKRILRLVASGLLPTGIAQRRKSAFGTPIAAWLNSTELKPMVMDRLENGKLLKDICKKESLHKIVSLLKSGRISRGGPLAFEPANVIWGMFALQVWHDTWF
jgi:asparagine synthase (glutamine-hydrolysing)